MLTKKLKDPQDFQMKNFNKMDISLYHDVGQISKFSIKVLKFIPDNMRVIFLKLQRFSKF